MTKRKISIEKDFETPLADDGGGRGKGIFVGLMVLSIVGLAVWFLVYNHESH